MSDALPTPNAPTLIPARQQLVDFYGDRIPAGQLADGTITVPLRPVVRGLGLDGASQYQCLKRRHVTCRGAPIRCCNLGDPLAL